MLSASNHKKNTAYKNTQYISIYILEFIFIATSHKYCTFTITYVLFGNLSLFASYALFWPEAISNQHGWTPSLCKGDGDV